MQAIKVGTKDRIKQKIEVCEQYVISSYSTSETLNQYLTEAKEICYNELDKATSEEEINSALEKFAKAVMILL